jgi:hypothetical protein
MGTSHLRGDGGATAGGWAPRPATPSPTGPRQPATRPAVPVAVWEVAAVRGKSLPGGVNSILNMKVFLLAAAGSGNLANEHSLDLLIS